MNLIRPQLMMTKLWQMMQSKDTTNLHLYKDLHEILSKNQTNRRERVDQDKETGRNTKMKINNRHSPGLKLEMESTLSFVAEWVFVKGVTAPQGACVPTSTKAKERQYRELLSDFDYQVWKELSHDWQRYQLEKDRDERFFSLDLKGAVTISHI